MLTITGRCHCGNITYHLHWPDEPELPGGRTCRCDYCQMHGATWTSHPDAEVHAIFENPAQIHDYHFGHRTATFHVCAVCGVVPLASCMVGNRAVAVTNINTFTSIDSSTLARTPTNFDGESEIDRLNRRQRNWTPLRIIPK